MKEPKGVKDVSDELLKTAFVCAKLSGLTSGVSIEPTKWLENIPDGQQWEKVDFIFRDSIPQDLLPNYPDTLFRCKNKLILALSNRESRSSEGAYRVWLQAQGDPGSIPKSYKRAEFLVGKAQEYAQNNNCELSLVTGICWGGSRAIYAGLKNSVPVLAIVPIDLGEDARKDIPFEILKKAKEYVTAIHIQGDPLSPWTEITIKDIEEAQECRTEFPDPKACANSAFSKPFLWREGPDGNGISTCMLGKQIEFPAIDDQATGWRKHNDYLPAIEKELKERGIQ